MFLSVFDPRLALLGIEREYAMIGKHFFFLVDHYLGSIGQEGKNLQKNGLQKPNNYSY